MGQQYGGREEIINYEIKHSATLLNELISIVISVYQFQFKLGGAMDRPLQIKCHECTVCIITCRLYLLP